MAPPRTRPPRIAIEEITPRLDDGRYAPKHTAGRELRVGATLLRDGHEPLAGHVELLDPAGEVHLSPLAPVGGDRFAAPITPAGLGAHRFRVVAWVDRFGSWREEISRKQNAGQHDLAGEAAEGLALLAGVKGLPAKDRSALSAAVSGLESGDFGPALDPAIAAAVAERGALRGDLARSVWMPLDVDREVATVGAWYELFPRSFGGFAGVAEALPRLAELGFDVVYLPPVHPIGRTNRKGPNNSLTAGPGDPGSPWAIGGAEGGHDAVHPDLGTLDEFAAMIGAARENDIEIALDLALQCSPDHPWLAAHPEWFQRRPDGTIKYAENPPKRYQDIHNLDFSCADWRQLWTAIRDVVLLWVERGVRIFRVDNPHTKPIPFWEWLIADIRGAHPDVVFLAEAFTRPDMMRLLAKVGFSQSYTYFTWKNTKAELIEFIDLMRSWSDCYRPNLFANTPDILHAYLQDGGPPAFQARLVLAAMLGPSYGIYSGFESYERVAVRPGSEEYVDSEKYQLADRDLDGPLLGLVARVNRIRRDCPEEILAPARVLESHSENVLCVAKGSGAGALIVCVNLDPHAAHEASCVIPDDLVEGRVVRVRDLLTDRVWEWGKGGNYVRLDPAEVQAHILRVEPA